MIDASSPLFTEEFRALLKALPDHEARLVEGCMASLRARAHEFGNLGFIALAIIAIQELTRIQREFPDVKEEGHGYQG